LRKQEPKRVASETAWKNVYLSLKIRLKITLKNPFYLNVFNSIKQAFSWLCNSKPQTQLGLFGPAAARLFWRVLAQGPL